MLPLTIHINCTFLHLLLTIGVGITEKLSKECMTSNEWWHWLELTRLPATKIYESPLTIWLSHPGLPGRKPLNGCECMFVHVWLLLKEVLLTFSFLSVGQHIDKIMCMSCIEAADAERRTSWRDGESVEEPALHRQIVISLLPTWYLPEA